MGMVLSSLEPDLRVQRLDLLAFGQGHDGFLPRARLLVEHALARAHGVRFARHAHRIDREHSHPKKLLDRELDLIFVRLRMHAERVARNDALAVRPLPRLQLLLLHALLGDDAVLDNLGDVHGYASLAAVPSARGAAPRAARARRASLRRTTFGWRFICSASSAASPKRATSIRAEASGRSR